jgi:hypothetical protein
MDEASEEREFRINIEKEKCLPFLNPLYLPCTKKTVVVGLSSLGSLKTYL